VEGGVAESGDEGRGSWEIATGRGGRAGRSSTGAGGSGGNPSSSVAEGEMETGGETGADRAPDLCAFTVALAVEPDFGILP